MADMIDVSSLQHPHGAAINYEQVAASGVQAVMVKASEGVHYVNPWLAKDGEEFRKAGLHVGFYHFAHPGQTSPAEQVDYFARAVGTLRHDIGLSLDLERKDGKRWAQLADWAHTFLDALGHHTQWASLYTDRSWLADLPGAPFNHRLWLASPGVHPDRRPFAWQMGTATVPGISAMVDVGQLYDIPGL